MGLGVFPEDRDDEASLVDLLKPLWKQRRFLVGTTTSATILAIVIAVLGYALQPIVWTSRLEFRPTFQNADLGHYPNGALFAPSDVVDPSVLDQVFDANKIKDFCDRAEFRSAFSTTRHPPDRYVLMFMRPASCRAMPDALAVKTLNDVLLTWASDSESLRGVLKQRTGILTSNVFDVGRVGHDSAFVRADLIWTSIDRTISNMAVVAALPGADLVRVGQGRVSLAELKLRMENLQRGLESLLMSGERDRESVLWIEGALAEARRDKNIAQARAHANLEALRVFSEPAVEPGSRGPGSRGEESAAQSARPLLDRAGLDRIIEMSVPALAFREQLTRDMLLASLQAATCESTANHYLELLAALKNGRSPSSASFESRLSEIVAEGKEAIRQFDDLYDEWSRVAFRPGPAMYHVETPGTIEVVRPYTAGSYTRAVALVFFVTLMLAVTAALLYTRIWPALNADK